MNEQEVRGIAEGIMEFPTLRVYLRYSEPNVSIIIFDLRNAGEKEKMCESIEIFNCEHSRPCIVDEINEYMDSLGHTITTWDQAEERLFEILNASAGDAYPESDRLEHWCDEIKPFKGMR